MTSAITNPFSEQELIIEIKEGNRNAFQILFYQYYKKLIDFALYRTQNLEVSRDLVQEVFTIVWEKKDNLNPEKSIKSYLYKALTNKVINFYKHSSSKTHSLEESHYSAKTDDQSTLESKIDLFMAINSLPDKLKSVFMLSRIENFKYVEIAEILDISVKAVEKRMTKALKILRKKIID